jgi:hypothetical protein
MQPVGPESLITVHVTRYRIARVRAGQALVPFVIISSIVARRMPETIPVGIAVLLQLATAIALFSARRSFGWRPFRIERGVARVGQDLEIVRHRVLRWTAVGNVTRIYCSDISLRLRSRTEDTLRLSNALQSWLGAPIRLQRRGTRRARGVALTVSLAGLALVAVAFAFSKVALVVLGIPCFIIGIATFGALSQRVARM